MKKIKYLSIILLLLLCVCLACFCAGCDFIKYVEIPENSRVVTEEVKQFREDYVNMLYEATSATKYRDKEQKLYEYAVQDAVNELNECFSEAELREVYDKHLTEISKIKTDKEYSAEEETRAIDAYRAAILNQADESYDRNKYSQNQKAYLDDVFSDFSARLSESSDREEMNGFLQTFYFDLHKEDEVLSLIEYADMTAFDISSHGILSETLKQCTEDIRSCKDEEHIDDIKAVYLFEVYRQVTIKKLNDYVDLSLYRQEQTAEIELILGRYLETARQAETETEADNVFRDYQIAVYSIPTDGMLYSAELDELKTQLSGILDENYKLSLYRPDEGLKVRELLKSFSEMTETMDRKEDILSQYLLVKSELDAVKTAKVLDEEDRAALIEQLYAQLKNDIENKIKESDRADFLKKAELTYNAMCDRVSLDGIRQEYSMLAQEILGNTIDYYRNELLMFKSSVFYREKEQSQVDLIKSDYLAKLVDDLEIAKAKEILQEAKEKIELIKTDDDLWNEDLEKFRTDLKDLYGDHVLEEPNSLTEANNCYELARIIDYYAFYQIGGGDFLCDTFRVKLNFDHGDAESEINNVYWQCELVRSGAGVYGEFEQSNYLVLSLIPYDLATTSNRDSTNRIIRNSSLVEFKSEGEKVALGSDFDDFPYKKYDKKLVGIWNTQQLWYALEHEYVPVCVAGSPAENTLEKAKEILRGIIYEGMSDDEKIFRIYSWFGENVQYDYKYTYDFYQSVLENYPEAATSRAFHAEGAICDGLAVCEGYAKAYLLLLRLVGIESYRIVKSPAVKGRIIRDPGSEKYYSGGYGSHAFVGIRMGDGLLYYSDPEASFVTGASHLQTYHQFMVAPSLFTGYGGQTFLLPRIEVGTAYGEIYLKFQINNESLFVVDKVGLQSVIGVIDNIDMKNRQISVFCDLMTYSGIKNDLVELIGLEYKEKKASNSNAAFVELIIYG